MAKLIYTAITSLDGFIEDRSGGFEWAAPDEDVHAYFNDLMRGIGTNLYGRRMYETMAVWETMGTDPSEGAVEVDFAEGWRGSDKVVYSRTLQAVSTPRTRLERQFDPDSVRRLVADADHDVSISGPDLAGHAFRAGLVDEVHLFLHPIVVGGGKPGLPPDIQVDLELVHEHRFTGGVVHLHHRIR